MLRIWGSGGWRFYDSNGTGGYNDPVGDYGALSVYGGTYTYVTADGESWTFNSSGYMTQWTSADGDETLQYRYDGGNRLVGITAIDGALTTITYTGSTTVTFQTVNSRVTTLTLDGSNNLTNIVNPDGGVQTLSYDSSHHLTQESLGLLQNNWAYTSAGVVGTYTWGALSYNSLTNLSRYTYQPANTLGLTGLVKYPLYASITDPLGNSTLSQMDPDGRPTTILAADGSITAMTYSNGFVTTETDPQGTTTYTLDGEAYVTNETLPDGSVITYQYQLFDHALTTMTDQRGNSTTYAYDSHGHMTGMTDALGDHTTYTYLTDGLLQSVTDGLNHTTTYTYDSDRRQVTVTDPTGATTTYSYDANGNLETTTDALGRVTTQNYDVMGRVVNTIDALGDQTTMTYDVSGLELTSSDALNAVTTYSYDYFSQGLVLQVSQGFAQLVVTTLNTYDEDGQLQTTRDANGWTTTNTYDAVGQQTDTTNALGNSQGSKYNLAGQAYQTTNENGYATTYAYNAVGEMTNQTDALGNRSTVAYDAAGNQTASTDALHHTTTYTYDALNRQTVVEDPLGRLVTTTYDADGNVLTVTDARGYVTSYAYDADNRETAVTQAVGTSVQATTRTSYDAVGNVISTTDANNNITTYTYDNLNRQIQVTDPLNRITTTTYDAVGDVISTEDSLGTVVTYTYDGLHRQIGTTDSLNQTTTVMLDNNGNEVQTTDPKNEVTKYGYDATNTQNETIDPRGTLTLDTLTPTEATKSITDSAGNKTTYELDKLDRADEPRSMSTGTGTTVYDAAGRVSRVTDADGRVIQYSYDAANRTTGEVWKNGTVTVNVVTYSYDNNDNLTSAADYNGTVTYTYDALDRVQSYTNIYGQVLTYSYDGNGNETQRTDSLGGTLTYVYDAANRLTSEQFSGTGATGTVVRVDFGYDVRNEQTTITWYSNLAGTAEVAASAYSYDAAGRLTGIVNTNSSSATLSYYTYTYDTADRVTAQTHWSQVGTFTYTGTNAYTYDADSELLTDGTKTYTYNANGNRTMAGYVTGSNNEMTNDGTWTYTYDAVGNLIKKSKGSGLETWYYTYDNRNDLTVVRDTSNGTTTTLQITYTYDVQGNRVQEQLWQTGGSTTTTRYAYDGSNVWADLDGGNNILVRYEYGDGADQILTRTVASSGSVTAYLTDNEGSVRDLVNWSGQVVDHLDYSGYGVFTLESNPSVADRFKYDGYQFEATTGLYYVNARWYDPTTGRWTQVDPMGFAAGDNNLYRYVGNDPTNTTDPTGLVAPPVPPVVLTQQLLPPTTVNPITVKPDGQFTWGVQFKLSSPSGPNGGLIIQRVQRKVMFFNGRSGKYQSTSDNLRDCPIRWQLRIMGYENTSLSQRHHRRPVGAVRASHSCLPRWTTAQDQPARCRQRHFLHPADGLPVAVSAQGLPAQEHRLALFRRVASQRHPRHHPRSAPQKGPHRGEALRAPDHRQRGQPVGRYHLWRRAAGPRQRQERRWPQTPHRRGQYGVAAGGVGDGCRRG